ncbi:MAG: hypothetical protein HYY65_04380 [Candidatus Tectomicrobia bacterium]|uniref:Uncharacterized protein n=1 Tax=Tectimicrobiota bacterium TaxID=2528274 RepID=A0A932M063_UNCTE|nr:hypothetical protein [Candidatus Tectomicrobia bacterium]
MKKVFMDQETAGFAPEKITLPDCSRSITDQEDFVPTARQEDGNPEWEETWLADFTCG